MEDFDTEVYGIGGMEFIETTGDMAVGNREFADHKIVEILNASVDLGYGVYVLNVTSGGNKIELTNDTVIKTGDIVTVHGVQEDLQRLTTRVGPAIIPSDKTDFVFHGLGIAMGLLIGLAVVKIGSIALTLGSGGGALMSGLVFGRFKSRHMTLGNLPTAASTLPRDLGLAGFVVVVGLQSGQQAVTTIVQSGLTIFVAGVIVTIVPLIITMLVGRYILRYEMLRCLRVRLLAPAVPTRLLVKCLIRPETLSPLHPSPSPTLLQMFS